MHFIGGFCYCLWVFTLRLEVVTCMAVTESSGFGSCWQPCSDEWIWYVWSPACKCLCLGCIQPGWGVCNEVARHVFAGPCGGQLHTDLFPACGKANGAVGQSAFGNWLQSRAETIRHLFSICMRSLATAQQRMTLTGKGCLACFCEWCVASFTLKMIRTTLLYTYFSQLWRKVSITSGEAPILDSVNSKDPFQGNRCCMYNQILP